jgi:peptide/nickel transport system substrate-binding protein
VSITRRSPVSRSFLVALLVLVCAGPAAAAPEGQLTYAVHVTLVSRWLDPAEAEGIVTPFMVLYALHDAVVKPMPGQPLAPSLAESWTVSKDGSVVEFVLRKGVTFHNGDPFTADDVRFSFQRYKGVSAKLLKERVREIEVVNAHRVRFHLAGPWPDFFTIYGTPASGAAWIVPKRYLEKVGEEGFQRAPVGLGPYRFVSFKPGIELVLEANETYWRKVPSVKRLVMKVVPDESTRLAMLKRREADVAYGFLGPTAQELQRDPGLKLVPTSILATHWINFHEQFDAKSPWHDRRVRLAANHAVDRQALNQAETLGFSRPTGGIIPKEFEFVLPLDAYPYDPARARRLLAEAGYPNGFDGGEFSVGPPYFSLGETLIGYLQAVGIRTKLRTMERAAFFAAWRDKKLRGLSYGATGASGNAATRIESFFVSGGPYAYGGYPDIDELARAQARELDRGKREDMLHQIQRLAHERVMFAPMWQYTFLNGTGPGVADARFGAISGFPYTAPYEDLRLRRP